MTNLLDTFEQLEKHGREWLDFSQQAYGWDTREFGNNYVHCYFAPAGDHRSVRLGNYDCQIEINFHTPVQFGGVTHAALKSLQTILEKSIELLASHRVIAAAPQPLEALRAARAVLTSILGTETESHIIAEQIAIIDAAIAKAEVAA